MDYLVENVFNDVSPLRLLTTGLAAPHNNNIVSATKRIFPNEDLLDTQVQLKCVALSSAIDDQSIGKGEKSSQEPNIPRNGKRLG